MLGRSIHCLHPDEAFPPLSAIRDDLGGLLAVGGGLSPARLLAAYRQGLFPWGTLEGLPLWYHPDPRMVLAPADFRLHRSLRQTLRRTACQVSVDTDFASVIAACAGIPRSGQDGTWITPDMQAAYRTLHELGWAHSVEVRAGGDLIGGLYGLAIGRVFFGESMFSRRTDASKIAFAHLCRHLDALGYALIDCQMHTPHLARLGAAEIPRAEFIARLAVLTKGPTPSLAHPHLQFEW